MFVVCSRFAPVRRPQNAPCSDRPQGGASDLCLWGFWVEGWLCVGGRALGGKSARPVERSDAAGRLRLGAALGDELPEVLTAFVVAHFGFFSLYKCLAQHPSLELLKICAR